MEVWASIRTGSLGLLSDAAHLLVDLSGLLFAYWALRLAAKPADPQATYGYVRAEVLAAAANGILLVGISAFIVVRAVQRLGDPLESLDTTEVLVVALFGLAANLGAAWLLARDAKENINTRGAFLNVLGDGIASVGVIVATLAVRYTGDTIYDTLVSFLVAAIIVVSGWGLLRSTTAILLETAPAHLDPPAIKAAVERVPGVLNVHDLHVWTLTPGHYSASLHVSIEEAFVPAFFELTRNVEALLAREFDLHHCTIQVEPEGDHESDHHDPVAEPL